MKRTKKNKTIAYTMSRLSQARGLKQNFVVWNELADKSRLSQARGLKPPPDVIESVEYEVAPLAGAWIETSEENFTGLFAAVAPLAGAWIETIYRVPPHMIANVAPLAGAWIETHESPYYPGGRQVAPLAGAWIETLTSCAKKERKRVVDEMKKITCFLMTSRLSLTGRLYDIHTDTGG